MNNETAKRRKAFFIWGLILLTAFLTFVFGSGDYKMEEFVREGQASLLEYYVNNLKPLFTSRKLDKKDVFDFAETGKLPLDKTGDKELVVLSTMGGNKIFKLQKRGEEKRSSSYQNFVDSLKLSPQEREELDSLLNAFTKPLERSVFVGKKESFAVNSDLGKLREILKKNIEEFEKKAREGRYAWKLTAKQREASRAFAARLKKEILKGVGKNFFVIAPDTVFTVTAEMKDSLENALHKKVRFLFKIDSTNASKNAADISINVDSSGVSILLKADTSRTQGDFGNGFSLDVNSPEDSTRVRMKFGTDTTNDYLKFGMEVLKPDTTVNLNFKIKMQDISDFISRIPGMDEKEKIEFRDSLRAELLKLKPSERDSLEKQLEIISEMMKRIFEGEKGKQNDR